MGFGCRQLLSLTSPPSLAFHAQWWKGMEGNHSLQRGQPGIMALPPPVWVCVLGFHQSRSHPGSQAEAILQDPPTEPQRPDIYPRTSFWARVKSVLGQAGVSLMAENTGHHLPAPTLWVPGLDGVPT